MIGKRNVFSGATYSCHSVRDRNDVAAASFLSLHFSKSLMNSLYTLGVRQTNSLQADLERLRNGDNSASLLGAF